MDIKRSSGLILHPTSLPSKYGIGDFGKSTFKFLDLLHESKTSLWQVLPLGITDEIAFSPYASKSSILGNPYLISLDYFENEISNKDLLKTLENLPIDHVNFEKVYETKNKIFYELSNNIDLNNDEIKKFLDRKLIKEHIVFKTLSDKLKINWTEWDKEYLTYSIDLYNHVISNFNHEFKFNVFTQYHFYLQWQKVKEYANSKNIKILGDIPIYVNHDSADVWLNKHLFDLDENFKMNYVSGAVPDAFTTDGQIWGTALYNWDNHLEENYKYWINKLNILLENYDFLRIDHFVGFFQFWAIPQNESALNGHWRNGPWKSFFEIVSKKVPFERLLAEDLGVELDETDKILKEYNIPGMLLLEQRIPNGDDSEETEPELWEENYAAYTGTHDSPTIKQWLDNANTTQLNAFNEYSNNLIEKFSEDVWNFISLIWSTPSVLAITTAQDLLQLGSDARFNVPGTEIGNWKWRLSSLDLLKDPLNKISKLNEVYNRSNS